MKYIYIILISLLVGFLAGKLLPVDTGEIYEIALYFLIFIVGLDMGLEGIKNLKKAGRASLIIPLLTLVGAILGGILGAFILGIPLKWAMAVTAGCGWYTFTGPIIAQYSPLYGTIGFLANLLREMVMVLAYPIGVRRIPSNILVSLGGASTMDSTLGIVKKYGTPENVLVSFIHGFIVTSAVMFLVPLILQF